jgi:uncharacterized protein involved in outer membrane biogenesis
MKLLLLLALVAVLAAAAWVVLLPRLIAGTVRSQTGFELKVDYLRVNPLAGSVSIRGLVLENPPDWPVREFVELRAFRAEVTLLSLFRDRFEAEEVVLDVARVTLVRERSGRLNAVAFKDAFGAGAPVPPEARPPERGKQPAPQFLIRRLAVRIDRITYADHSGRQPVVREYPVAINRELTDVDSVAKLISPLYSANVAVVTEALGGMFAESLALLKGTGSALKEAGQKAGEAVKGFLDKLKPKN